MRLLLDTNVVIDYLGRKRPFYKHAQQVVAMGFFGDAELWMPAQSATDAFYVLKRYVGTALIQDALLELFKVVSPIALTEGDLMRAAKLKWNDFEDCLIAVAAARADADYIVTRDEKGFEGATVPAITPSNLMKKIGAEKNLFYSEELFEN